MARPQFMPKMSIQHVAAVLAGSPLRAKLFLLCALNGSREPWTTTLPSIAGLLQYAAGARTEGPDPSSVQRVLHWMRDQGMIDLETTPGGEADATPGVVIRFKYSKPITKPRQDGCNGDPPPGFLRWWDAWPPGQRKVGRGPCLKMWVDRKLEPQTENILAVLAAMCQTPQWTKDGGQFIPMPTTWLNQARYDADPADLFVQTPPPTGPKPPTVIEQLEQMHAAAAEKAKQDAQALELAQEIGLCSQPKSPLSSSTSAKARTVYSPDGPRPPHN